MNFSPLAQGVIDGDAVVGTIVAFAEIVVAMFASVSLFARHNTTLHESLTPTTLAR